MRNHNREKKTHLHLFQFPIWFGAGIKKIQKENQYAIVFSWTVKCGNAGNAFVWSEGSVFFYFVVQMLRLDTWREICDLTAYSWPAILPLKWPRFGTKHHCFIPMQNFWQDSEHHVWIVREKSKKGEGKKD